MIRKRNPLAGWERVTLWFHAKDRGLDVFRRVWVSPATGPVERVALLARNASDMVKILQSWIGPGLTVVQGQYADVEIEPEFLP